jgi:hypothetical protein
MNSLCAVRAQRVCYPGVYYPSTPISDQSKMPNAARDPTTSELMTA